MARVVFDPFEALGLPRDASNQSIKSTYHSLAKKYHPNRTIQIGENGTKESLTEHFHNIQQAWDILSRADNRRRRVELLDLLDLQDDMLTHFMDVIDQETSTEQEQEHHRDTELDGYVSSDADEDLPNVGIQRRKTVLEQERHAARQLGERRESLDTASPTSPSNKQSKWNVFKHKAAGKSTNHKDEDYFAERRRKLERLRKKEFAAFLDYRDAMVCKFEAEEEAEKQKERYDKVKWKREYLERAPRGTAERMRSFLNTLGAVTAFEQQTPKQRNRSGLSYSTMSPAVGPTEGSQFLLPDVGLSRQRTIMHRKTYSSDFTGDQTDSSDDELIETRGPRRISPPAQWQLPPRRGRGAMVDPSWRSSSATSAPALDIGAEPPGPKIFIRQPTGLGPISEGRDSSGETASSRSPSPQPNNADSIDLYSFTRISSTTADLFGVSPERRTRSPSPGHHRTSSFTHSPREPSTVGHSHAEGCQFTKKQLGIPHHRHIPLAHIHLLSRGEKSHMLGTPPDTETDPAVLLGRLRELDSTVASKFEVKPNMEEVFNFRLIYGNREVIASKQHHSFIALSYRRKLTVQKHEHHYTLPLQPEIFQAVWDERESENEGVWIDQICIQQESNEERTISMSAMDMVYRSARLIIVALDDVELDAQQGKLLQNHMDEYNSMTHVATRHRFRRKQPPFLDSHEDMYRIVRKLLSSSWFKRAWCRHEMRLAKDHIFLVPCKNFKTSSGRDVLRFNSKCIAHLLDLATEVPFEQDVESVKPALHAFFRDRSKMTPDQRQMHLNHGNFSSVVAEVFAMEAGGDPRVPAEQRLSDARKDKISIVLNTVESGLTLGKTFRIHGVYDKDHDCFRDLSLLALAARDPGALCSVGQPLPITDSAGSWIYEPTVADGGLNNTRTLQRLPDDAKFVTKTDGDEHCLQIDITFLPRGGMERPAMDDEMFELARKFTNVCEARKWGRNRKRYLIHDRKANLLFGTMKDIYIETLACVFHCGPNWMSEVCTRYSMSRWKIDLRGAYQLLIALMNTSGRWPEEAWSERAAGFVMDFVNFLIIRGLPLRQITRPETWRPLWVHTRRGGRVLAFAPVEQQVYAAVPTVLINPDYVHLARLWLLKPRWPSTETDPDGSKTHDRVDDDAVLRSNKEWTLMGKSVLFSDDLAIGQLHDFGGSDVQNFQRIYGRFREKVADKASSSALLSPNGIVHKEGGGLGSVIRKRSWRVL